MTNQNPNDQTRPLLLPPTQDFFPIDYGTSTLPELPEQATAAYDTLNPTLPEQSAVLDPSDIIAVRTRTFGKEPALLPGGVFGPDARPMQEPRVRTTYRLFEPNSTDPTDQKLSIPRRPEPEFSEPNPDAEGINMQRADAIEVYAAVEAFARHYPSKAADSALLVAAARISETGLRALLPVRPWSVARGIASTERRRPNPISKEFLAMNPDYELRHNVAPKGQTYGAKEYRTMHGSTGQTHLPQHAKQSQEAMPPASTLPKYDEVEYGVVRQALEFYAEAADPSRQLAARELLTRLNDEDYIDVEQLRAARAEAELQKARAARAAQMAGSLGLGGRGGHRRAVAGAKHRAS